MKRLGLLFALLTIAVFLFLGASTNHHEWTEQEALARQRKVEMAMVEVELDKLAAQTQQFVIRLDKLRVMADRTKGKANTRRRK